MLTALYTIIITPLIQITEFFYELFYEITRSQGIAVLGLSFVVTIFTLPLYMVAEQWQEKERKIQAKLKDGIGRIKSTFKGDEQYMILSVFYRQNHYHPIMALRSSFSLLIQIPFFIAAYNFLSDLANLKGYSFLFIKDFGAPDATFSICGFPVNLLPLAMTLINCIAGAVYSKGHGIQEKLQIYGCAFVFLALLYNSPSGLVIYWTMNNVLSLVKNVFYKIKNPKKILYILTCAAAAAGIFSAFFIFSDAKKIFRLALIAFCILIPAMPFAISFLSKRIDRSFSEFDRKPQMRLALFVLSSLTIVLLTGAAIPSILMESEPQQYSFVDSYKSPLFFIFYTFCQALGFFFVWPMCFYGLFSAKTKKVLTLISMLGAATALVNCFAFSGNYGPIGPDMLFLQPQNFSTSTSTILLNFSVLVAVFFAVVFVSEKHAGILNTICAILLLSLAAISGKNIVSINSSFKKMEEPGTKDKIESVFHLSKEGKNVIILMQDKLVSSLIPEILKNTPQLYSDFDGFTYFPNTVSFGHLTMLGTPGIFGGYDYTPFEINRQTEKTLQQKHNEAILSMPLTFYNNGFEVSIADMPYENYLEYPVTDMYKGYEFINRVVTRGIYSKIWYKRSNMTQAPFLSTNIKRNGIWFSFFKIVPTFLRKIVYHKRYWLSYQRYRNDSKFIDNYSELDFLSELFDVNAKGNTFTMLDNEATHEAILLQAPDFIPAEKVTQFDKGSFGKLKQYMAQKAMLLRFAKFIEYLKANNVYDNTRIIIVSDHGTTIQTNLFDKNPSERIPFLKESVTATILFKDFSATGPLKTDNTFMTNADTPALAFKSLVPQAKNPFTGKLFEITERGNKADFVKIAATADAESTRIRHNNTFSIKDSDWYTVKDNIFQDKNWNKLYE